MKWIAGLATTALLSACGSGAPQQGHDFGQAQASYAGPVQDRQQPERLKEAAKQKRLDNIEYPECRVVWQDGITTCGLKVFTEAMMECQRIAAVEGAGSLVDRISAGNSWLIAAGADATATMPERIKRLDAGDVDLSIQPFAVISGHGRREIKNVHCILKGFKLTNWFSSDEVVPEVN